jgi:hypothetical protein
MQKNRVDGHSCFVRTSYSPVRAALVASLVWLSSLIFAKSVVCFRFLSQLQARIFLTHVEAMRGQMRSNVGIACHAINCHVADATLQPATSWIGYQEVLEVGKGTATTTDMECLYQTSCGRTRAHAEHVIRILNTTLRI